MATCAAWRARLLELLEVGSRRWIRRAAQTAAPPMPRRRGRRAGTTPRRLPVWAGLAVQPEQFAESSHQKPCGCHPGCPLTYGKPSRMGKRTMSVHDAWNTQANRAHDEWCGIRAHQLRLQAEFRKLLQRRLELPHWQTSRPDGAIHRPIERVMTPWVWKCRTPSIPAI